MTLILFILILGLIVLVHEFGHFIWAKKHGVYVFEFSIGFGPKLFSFKRKNDPTEYMVKLIPLGGYVAMAGEDGDIEEQAGELKIKDSEKLCNKTFLQRFTVLVAGVTNNFILGIVLLFVLGFFYGIVNYSNTLKEVPEGSPLYNVGVRSGDVITKVNGKKVSSYDEIQTYLELEKQSSKKDNIEIKFTILKKSTNIEEIVSVKPKYSKEDKKYLYGISPEYTTEKGLAAACKYSVKEFVKIIKTLGIVIRSLVTGKLGLDSLSGPVGIYNVVGIAKSSLYSILYLIAYLSINVGFMNLLPFPAFDGGRALFLIIEKIKGSKLNPKFENTINTIGFVFLMMLMLIITVKDVIKIFF